ncbi:MAG: hypothetical protein M0Q13_11650 [Methanothrix sp.]|jgi:hypothetical protein|nr:hypothetical protein [Methanothrix sp.]
MSDEISKYEQEMNDYFEQIKQLCLKGFVDFVFIGIDVTGDSAQIFHVGDINKNSISNRDRIVRMIGELEDMKFNFQIGGYSLEENNEDNDEDSNEF